MAYTKKVWKSRISQNPSRRLLTNVSDSSTMLVDVRREEGVVSQEGDGFTKANMDDLENRISNAFKDEHTFLTGVLVAGSTQIDFTDASIVDGCMPHIYVPLEKNKMVPNSIAIIGTNTLRITFPAQTTNTTIKVKIEYDLTT